ncbi:small ribosomal subunit protein uS2-like [Ambystoma mexicanum]|uniref:small ribosomal subunit protein uS2-like n=1 Tax=Ambystoma mexicanum TaxID=8296 RepID=UPI0037E8DAED
MRDPRRIDVFASRLNTQLERFFSWRTDPAAEATDSFLQVHGPVNDYAIHNDYEDDSTSRKTAGDTLSSLLEKWGLDSPLRYVYIAIPCNNKGAHSVGLTWWMLAREVLRMQATISHEHPWEVMADLYFYRDPGEIKKEKQAAAEKAVTKEEFQGEWTAPVPDFPQLEVADWSEDMQVPPVPIQQFSAKCADIAITPKAPQEDWCTQPASTEDWSAAPTAQATEWVGAPTEWSYSPTSL